MANYPVCVWLCFVIVFLSLGKIGGDNQVQDDLFLFLESCMGK